MNETPRKSKRDNWITCDACFTEDWEDKASQLRSENAQCCSCEWCDYCEMRKEATREELDEIEARARKLGLIKDSDEC
jgi:hypothetical protein